MIHIHIILIIIQISADSPNLSRIHHGLNAQRLDDLCTFQTLGAKQQWKVGGLQSLKLLDSACNKQVLAQNASTS